MEKQSNVLAIVSLVLAILAWVLNFTAILGFLGTLFGLGGIVTGALGVDKKQGAMALIGLCLSIAAC